MFLFHRALKITLGRRDETIVIVLYKKTYLIYRAACYLEIAFVQIKCISLETKFSISLCISCCVAADNAFL